MKTMKTMTKPDHPRKRSKTKVLIREFGESTTMHGVGAIIHARDQGSRCIAIVWTVAITVAMVFFIITLSARVRHFMSDPVQSQVDISLQPQLPFPQLTICNAVPFSLVGTVNFALNNNMSNIIFSAAASNDLVVEGGSCSSVSLCESFNFCNYTIHNNETSGKCAPCSDTLSCDSYENLDSDSVSNCLESCGGGNSDGDGQEGESCTQNSCSDSLFCSMENGDGTGSCQECSDIETSCEGEGLNSQGEDECNSHCFNKKFAGVSRRSDPRFTDDGFADLPDSLGPNIPDPQSRLSIRRDSQRRSESIARRLEKIRKNGKQQKVMQDPAQTLANLGIQYSDIEFIAAGDMARIFRSFSEQDFVDAGIPIKDMLLRCELGDTKTCNHTQFASQFVDVNSGMCHTIDLEYSQRRPGPGDGVTLILDTQNTNVLFSDYLDGELEGIRLMIHAAGEPPHLPSSIMLQARHAADIVLDKSMFENTATRRDCRDGTGDEMYSSNVCYDECMDTQVHSICGCDKTTWYKCRDSRCLEAYNVLSLAETCSSQCKVPCNQTSFSPVVSRTAWPPAKMRDHYVENFVTWGICGNSSLLSESGYQECWKVVNRLTKVTIFFRDIRVTTVKKSDAYGLSELLSEMGGLAGLYVGISFLTMLEFIQLICRLGWIGLKKPAKAVRHLSSKELYPTTSSTTFTESSVAL